MPKVLLIEDNENIIRLMVGQLEGFAEVVVVKSCREALHALVANSKFDGAIVDGYLDRDELSIPIVPELRRSVRGPLIANSSDPEITRKLVVAGCTHTSPAKYSAAQLLKELLLKK